MSIYVIDDHPLMRDAIVMVLRRLRPAENIVELDRLDKLAFAHPARSRYAHGLRDPLQFGHEQGGKASAIATARLGCRCHRSC